MAEGKIDCLQCKHFVITWNPKFPKACKLYGFKSIYYPSSEVLKATGEECIGFEIKPQRQNVDR